MSEQSFQNWFKQKLVELEYDPDFIFYGVLQEFCDTIFEEMQRQGIKRTELAEKMGKKKPFITRILSGKDNMTLATAVKVGVALGLEMKIKFKPLVEETKEDISLEEEMADNPPIDFALYSNKETHHPSFWIGSGKVAPSILDVEYKEDIVA